MEHLNLKQNQYDRAPFTEVIGHDAKAVSGYASIVEKITEKVRVGTRTVITIEIYPGTNREELLSGLSALAPVIIINSEDMAFEPEKLDAEFSDNLTEDPVFGIMTTSQLSDYFYQDKLKSARKRIEQVESGVVLVFGVGASLVTEGDIFIYADLARWQIQLRLREGMSNWRSKNKDAPILSKYKRSFFIEWRLADRQKKACMKRFDFVLDTNSANSPKMITGDAFRAALKVVSERPFRLVPYFDPGVWGGQWMKEKFGLDSSQDNFAWSFDGVPEENSLLFRFGEVQVELPAMDLVLYQPEALLGARVYARFGAEFPIRFDLLDTVGGQNLSLQVHPKTEYIQEHFNMRYTQDESYYILDTKGDDCCVYLGIKEGVNPKEMEAALYRAKGGKEEFEADRFINKIPVKKHDHVLIPAGTVHCSGSGTMVLEISATPYIFTFKLWDWARVGLDGLPRPIHLEHGMKNIDWERDTEWVNENLVNRNEMLEKSDFVYVERTGLHEYEFIETVRYNISEPVSVQMQGSVHMLNLVDGDEVTVRSKTGKFLDFIVHYAETFIVPASVNEYQLVPSGSSEGKEIKVICASVR